jgi:hypothetical protein
MTTKEYLSTLTAEERAKNLRYKRPALRGIQRECLQNKLADLSLDCEEMRDWLDDEDIFATFNSEDDREDFLMAAMEIQEKIDIISYALQDNEITEYFDDFMVGIIGNQYNMVGYDGFEEDYFNLLKYEAEAGKREAGKRLMRLTKEQMIAVAGQCMGTYLAFYDLQRDYDYLRASFDVATGNNLAVEKVLREICAMYDAVMNEPYGGENTNKFNSLLGCLPDIVWVR